jgi:hypothetical protein
MSRQKFRLKEFENRVLREIFGYKAEYYIMKGFRICDPSRYY